MRRGYVALTALMLLVAASCAKDEGDLDEKDSATGEWAATLELLPAVGDVVRSLQQERAAVVVSVFDLPVEERFPSLDIDTARAETDDAVEKFEAAVTDGDSSAEIYGDALDSLGGLDEVRSEVDANTDASGMQLDSAFDLADSYGQIVTGVVDANRAAMIEIDDPQVRRGAELYAEGLRQTEVSATLLFVVTSGLDANTRNSSAWVSEVAEQVTLFDDGWSFVEETAADSPYQPLADQLEADLDEAGYFDKVPALLDGDEFDPTVVTSILLPPDKGWWPFLTGVERILRGRD